jgi:IS30 family transposase
MGKSKETEESQKTGRPLTEIDWEKVDNMCGIRSTGEEIAGVLGIGYSTLVRAIRREFDMTFDEYYTLKSQNGKVSIRRKQYQTAMNGNPYMLKWLGVNWLGQSDKQEVEHNVNTIKGIRLISD